MAWTRGGQYCRRRELMALLLGPGLAAGYPSGAICADAEIRKVKV
ncbi:hypothetical protein [Thermanaeromonas sp. C210]|nr:hypothetical protein [Thermanaeromonas sp. C210]